MAITLQDLFLSPKLFLYMYECVPSNIPIIFVSGCPITGNTIVARLITWMPSECLPSRVWIPLPTTHTNVQTYIHTNIPALAAKTQYLDILETWISIFELGILITQHTNLSLKLDKLNKALSQGNKNHYLNHNYIIKL